MELTFKHANEEDIMELLLIEQTTVGLKTYSAMLEQSEWEDAIKNGPVFLVKNSEEENIGYVSYELKSNNHAYISGIVIVPKFQGQGLAKRIMNHVLEEIHVIKRIDLVTHPDNIKAIKLYESLGFTIESRKENYFGDGEPRVTMALERT